jgi:hypothetical protein
MVRKKLCVVCQNKVCVGKCKFGAASPRMREKIINFKKGNSGV